MNLFFPVEFILICLVLLSALVYVLRKIWIAERKHEDWLIGMRDAIHGDPSSRLFMALGQNYSPSGHSSFDDDFDHRSLCDDSRSLFSHNGLWSHPLYDTSKILSLDLRGREPYIITAKFGDALLFTGKNFLI